MKDQHDSLSVDECMEVFFSSPSNRLIMAMFGVHDGDMTVKEALEFAKNG